MLENDLALSQLWVCPEDGGEHEEGESYEQPADDGGEAFHEMARIWEGVLARILLSIL